MLYTVQITGTDILCLTRHCCNPLTDMLCIIVIILDNIDLTQENVQTWKKISSMLCLGQTLNLEFCYTDYNPQRSLYSERSWN